MTRTRGIVIVGGGLAGARAAQTVREEGYGGPVVIVGEEDEAPYERPALSKAYLAGTADTESGLVHPPGWYDEHEVELRLGARVRELDLAEHVAHTDSGPPLGFDTLLLATGASSRRLRGPGSGEGLAGVHYLRTRAESDALRADLADGSRRVVVVGAGWIGLEVAAVARGYGNEVTVLGREGTPLEAALGPELGAVFADLHRGHGVKLRMSTSVAEISGSAGRVSGVRTDAGDVVPADVVVVGIGAVPNDGVARAAGLEVDDGVVVDAGLRTSHPDVYAVGDVASVFHPVLGRHLRVEHWANALNAAPVAARSMLGQDVVDDLVPYFYTDQFDLGMEYSGYATLTRDAEIVYRGDVGSGEFIAFWVAGERVVAGMNVNVWDVSPDIERLVRSSAPVDRVRLADPGVPLPELAVASAA